MSKVINGIEDLNNEFVEVVEDTEDNALPGYNLFTDVIKSINQKTGNLFDEDFDAANKAYTPYVVNEAFSHTDKYGNNDAFLFADAMNNMAKYLSKRMQYDFYYYGLPKSQRYYSWTKPEVINNIDTVVKYYGCSDKKAQAIVKILPQAQLDIMKSRLYESEITHEKSKSTRKRKGSV